MTADSSTDEVGTVVRRVLAYASSCDIEEITPERNMAGLGIDSVGVGGIGIVLESETGVAIDFEELIQLWARASVGDLIRRISELRQNGDIAG